MTDRHEPSQEEKRTATRWAVGWTVFCTSITCVVYLLCSDASLWQTWAAMLFLILFHAAFAGIAWEIGKHLFRHDPPSS